jgi:hypothetical protein
VGPPPVGGGYNFSLTQVEIARRGVVSPAQLVLLVLVLIVIVTCGSGWSTLVVSG